MAHARAAFAGSADPPELPDAAEFVWLAFNEMRGAVTYSSPISHSEMRAYVEMTGNALRSLEVSWVRDLDRAWMEQSAKKAQALAKGGKQPREVKIDDFAGIDRMLARQARHG